MSTPSAANGRGGSSPLPPRRPEVAGGRFDKPALSRDEIDALIRQARENANRLMLDALEKTDPKYRSFIVPIGQWKKVGQSGDRDIKAYVELPYMAVDGRVLMAIDEHMAQGKTITVQPAEFKDDPVSGQKLCRVTVKAELRGEATGTARVFLGGFGANRDNPVETAETSAIGRALGFLGYGCFGTGIASAEEMIAALGGHPARADAAKDPDAVRAPAPPSTPTPRTAPAAAEDAPTLLEALSAGTLERDRLAAAATTLLRVPEAGYLAYLTRTFGVPDPERLSDAQLGKEIEFLLRRTQQADQAERFRIQCEKLAQQAA